MGVKYRDGQNYPATYEDYVPPGAVARCMLEMMDYLYPVGCYFETTDTDFDPNQTFGGTWELEAEGLVHISSGTNYTVSNQDQDGGEAEHTLVEAEMPLHRHIQRKVVNNGGQATIINDTVVGTYSGDVLDSTKQFTWASNKAPVTTHEAGSDQPHNNMQPYKIVNRWHRTA